MSLNRLDLFILKKMYKESATDALHSLTIDEINGDDEEALCSRVNLVRRIKVLLEGGYIEKSLPDRKADTYIITTKGLKLLGYKESASE